MSMKAFASSRMFFDNKHFPRGFNRSGQFSRREAEILERHGFAMLELERGQREPACAEEHAFVEMTHGRRNAESDYEKAWSKYKYHTTNRRVSYSAGMSAAMADGYDSSDYTDTDVD